MTPAEDMKSLECRLNNDRDFCKALRDLESAIERRRAGAGALSGPPVPWDIQLRVFALQAVTDKRFRGDLAPDGWHTGKTPKSLANFPARLRAMAAEIECLNRSPLFSLPDLTLPLKMKIHADDIERSVALEKWRTHRQRGHSRWVLQLSDLVKRVTGRWHDEKVCKLLNAAADALNIEFGLDAPALAQARHRKRYST
jgi:hypothetical protein